MKHKMPGGMMMAGKAMPKMMAAPKKAKKKTAKGK